MPAPTLVEAPRAASAADPNRRSAFRRALLRWYDDNRRDLPWRRTRDPYRIWISEIMLQQTRVAAVLEHYRVFLERFPDVRTLASADEAAVLAAWSGLGYYRRARMMRHCAQKIMADHNGHFPNTSESLQTLPGIGRYTAAAIASIAFAEPVAVVDGNVERVLQRLAGATLASEEMWRVAQSQLSPNRPADFNQAMMELGALICTPRQPKCETCPIRKWCATQGESPRPTRTQSQSKREIWCTLDQSEGRIRLLQRPAKSSLMAGMWELPPAAPPKGRKKRHQPWQTFRHSITTTHYTVNVIQAPATRGKWISVEEISRVPLTGLTRKILRAAGVI